MHIKDFLSREHAEIDFAADDKAGLLKALAERAAAALSLPVATVKRELEKRDALGSTGIGGGISIPHARFREVDKPFGIFVRLKRPIEFQAIDGQPVDLVFALILPAASQLDQLNALAEVARRLREPDVAQALRRAATGSELYALIAGER